MVQPDRYPLDEVLGSVSQVRVVRFLTTDASRPSSAPEIARATGLTGQGVRNALGRLIELGYVVRSGGGRTHLYEFLADAPLRDALRRLFQVERSKREALERELRSTLARVPGVRSAWVSSWPATAREPLEIALVSDVRQLPEVRTQSRSLLSSIETRNNLVIEVNYFTPVDAPVADSRNVTLLAGVPPQGAESSAPRVKGQQRAARTMVAIAELLKDDPALRTRARHHVDWLLQEDQGIASNDLLEWRQILDTYSDERLYDFLRSESPRATRLYQSSPLIPALTPTEMEEMLTLLLEDER